MSMSFEIDRDRGLCTIRMTGTISMSDVKAGVRAQVDAGVWTWRTVIDTTAATDILTTAHDVDPIVHVIEGEQAVNRLPPRGPIVIVVPDHRSKVYDLARLYQLTAMQTAGLRVEIVKRLEDAQAAFERLQAA